MQTCVYCDRPAWYADRTTGDYLCPEHARLEVRGPRPGAEAATNAEPLRLRASTPDDEPAILEMWFHFWDDNEMDCFGRVYRAADLPALLACDGERVVGLLSYAVERRWHAINIVALQVLPAEQGRGGAAALVGALEAQARRMGIDRLIVATSNDNLLALYFYQRLGFQISALKAGAVAPDDPEEEFVGVGRIAVRDEVRLEKRLAG